MSKPEFAPEPSTEKIANDVKERIDHNDLKGAYNVLHLEANALLQNNRRPTKER